jgi:hypothetical protein
MGKEQTISQGQRGFMQTARDVLPQGLAQPLFGTGREVAPGETVIPGMQADQVKSDTGLLGFMYETLVKSDQRKYDELFSAIASSGVSKERAGQIAGRQVPFSDLTPEEQKIVVGNKVLNVVFGGLELLDAVPVVGAVTRPVRVGLKSKILNKIVSSNSAKDIATELRQTHPIFNTPESQRLAEVLANTREPETVQNLIDSFVQGQNFKARQTAATNEELLTETARLRKDLTSVEPGDAQRLDELGAEANRRTLSTGEMDELRKIVENRSGQMLEPQIGLSDIQRPAPTNQKLAKAIVERVDGRLPSPEVGAMDIKPAPKAPSLVEEAKKYKSAEEFVKAQTPRVGGVAPELQGQTLYRGMSEAEWQAIQNGGLSGKASRGGRTFVTTDKSTTEFAVEANARAGKKSVVVELKPEANQKVIRGEGVGEGLRRGEFNGDYEARNIGLDDIARVTDSKGKVVYEATTGGKTKSQLEDIWKQANQPVNKKLADFNAGKPSSQGGYVANPFKVTDKGAVPTTPRVPNSGNPQAFDAAADGLMRDSWTKLREVVQDNWIRAKNLQRTPGVKVDKGADPYLAETLFHGRVHTRLQEVKDNVIKIDKDIVNTAKKFNTNSAELTRTVNKYLQATHAPERNAKLGDGAAGITTKEAEEFVASVNASSLGKEVKRVTDELLELNRRTLTTLKEAQVIDDETYKVLTETYKNHVPLNRILDTTEDITQALSGRGFSVRGSGIQRAKGSEREVADIITNITTNVEQAIIRAEKNLVDLNTLRFARNNKELGLFEEIKPKALGLDFEGKPIMQQVNDPQVLAMRENGKPVYLKINDPHMAAMYQNVNLEHIPNMMQWIATFTRLYSSLHTRFNYEFALSNKVRDIQEMAVDMASRKEMGFKQAGQAMTREPESIKAVTDFIRGKDSEGARLYKQMQMDGGTTGGLSLSTRKQVEVDIEKIRQLNRSQPRRAARILLEAVDNWNTIFEDSTRLSVYKTALKNGLDRETAAMLAKESTVNFNKKGTGGSVINGLYMFSNASIQGTTKMLRAMKNPKVAGAVVGGMGLAVYNLNKFNDSVDPDWRDKVTDFDRTSNMVLFLPSESGEAKYITIPVSWGLKPIKVAMEHANDLMTGHNDSVPDAVRGIMVAAATSYNPLAGSESVVETLTPTFLKTPQEITSNVAWHGGKIRPDYDPNMPKSAQYFRGLENKATGRVAISATEKLAEATNGEIEISPANINYAFEAYIGGLGRSVTKILNTITSIGKGEELKASEIPIASRFFKVRDTDQTEAQKAYSVLDEQKKTTSARTFEADKLFRELRDLPTEERQTRLREIAEEDPSMVNLVANRFQKDSMSSAERAISSLTNENKATYILTQIEKMPIEERREYIKGLLDRGVISVNVVNRLAELASERDIIEQ